MIRTFALVTVCAFDKRTPDRVAPLPVTDVTESHNE